MRHISASQLAYFAECSLRYKFRYVDINIKPQKSIHLVYGSSIHAAFELINKNMVDMPALVDVYQEFDDSWDSECEAVELDPHDYYNDKLYLMALKSIEKYYGNFLDYEICEYNADGKIIPASELAFEVPIKLRNGQIETEYCYRGFIDAVIKKNNKICVLDYKTAKEPYSKFKIDTNIQLTLYAYAFRYLLLHKKFPQLLKKTKEDLTLYHMLIKDYDTLDGKIIEAKKIAKDEDFIRLAYITEKTIQAIRNEIYIPNYGDQCRWCDYKKECASFVG